MDASHVIQIVVVIGLKNVDHQEYCDVIAIIRKDTGVIAVIHVLLQKLCQNEMQNV